MNKKILKNTLHPCLVVRRQATPLPRRQAGYTPASPAGRLHPDKKGFTLIEVMVSLTLFTVIMLITISSLIAINDANKKARDIRIVMDNLSFALENMSRNIRTGYEYYCGTDIATFPIGTRDCAIDGENSIAFISSENEQIIYRLDNDNQQIKRAVEGGAFLGITSLSMDINKLTFFVEGSAPGDNSQPRVVIVIQGIIDFKKGITTKFNLQTTISQRLLDS